ncbi:MAG: peptide/nickel transport system ATP-binding protein [Solirubrobacteraceae bacterium]
MSTVVPVEPRDQTLAAGDPPRFLRRLLRRPIAMVCLGYLLVLVGIAVVAPIALPHVATDHAGDLLATRQGPSWQHLLGTDSLGRDVLQRVLVGTRITLLGVAEGLVVVVALGLPLGLCAGYFGGRFDRVVTWIADLMFSVPAIIVIIIVLVVFPKSMLAAMCTLGVLSAPSLMRVVRSATLPVREELYIAAAQVAGLSRGYIVSRHVLPRIAGPAIVQASLFAAVALLVQSGLAFLSLVVVAPAPSWGGMVADGSVALEQQAWLIWPPGMAMVLTALAFGLLGDALRDTTAEGWSAPRQRRRPRRRRPAHRRETQHREPRTADSESLLSIAGLTVGFERGHGLARVVEDVSFEIRAGEALGLVGESGCGKTMTANAILGLLPSTARIEAGRIDFAGRDLAALPEKELDHVRGSQIGYISQEPMISLDPAFRIGSQLAEAVRTHHRVSRRQARARAIELLRDVRLPDPRAVARRYPHELSGGMAQRVAIARALAGQPRLLIADEPTTALDVTVQAEILDLLRELQGEQSMAIMLVTHDWGVVADICDRAVVMYAGQVVEEAELVPMFRQPRHPYTEALLASNPSNANEGDKLPAIPGTVPQPGAWPAGCHFHPRCAYATARCVERPIPLELAAPGRLARCIHHEDLAGAR